MSSAADLETCMVNTTPLVRGTLVHGIYEVGLVSVALTAVCRQILRRNIELEYILIAH